MIQRAAYLPAEWAPQDAVLLTWPHDQTDWATQLEHIEPVYIDMAKAITRFERLIIVARDLPLRAHIAKLLSHAGVVMSRVRILIATSNDSWARDHGPITVFDGQQMQPLSFTFNGWGGKYPSELDNQINQQLAEQALFKAAIVNIDLVLEGGGIETDGHGTLLLTKQCLLNPNRNPGLDQTAIEQRLNELLYADHFLWLSHGALEGDDTDSHIDTLVRFAPNDTLVYVACDKVDDEHYPELHAMELELKALRNRHGANYRLLPLPWPQAKYSSEGERLPATYANYLIIDGAVLVPIYDDPADEQALAVIAQAYPGREIIGIDCQAVIAQFGSLHCLTMQIPKGTLA
ncbi:agmatine deiminase family protein [Corallincola spongiicola]|uniref:Agmatine deiminase family protein n=1 Tax=Corallincola spongiicola TaxID=2520508 RepID=A0ABY1WU09_9GAMM|nr:agmatine deiminase family protein [Corallincola spongiicola]TAA48228.1 agmatine deiminase family protein [Corallincola spongiicola]